MVDSAAHILVVEDDESLRLALEDNLEDEGYRVTTASDGASAQAALSSQPFDLVILDLMLPDTDGYQLCADTRASDNSVPVLMLTARTLEDDLVRGFEAGADDYLAKPYRLKELLARVRALLRRGGRETAPEVYEFGPFRLAPTARTVVDGGGLTVELTRTEFDLLALLVQHPGRVFTRDDILDQVWGKDVVVDSRTVDNFVSSLKRKLGCRRDSGFAILTVRGVGYRMEIGSPSHSTSKK